MATVVAAVAFLAVALREVGDMIPKWLQHSLNNEAFKKIEEALVKL